MEIILCWATPGSGFWLVPVDYVANDDLDNVENKQRETELLKHDLDTRPGTA